MSRTNKQLLHNTLRIPWGVLTQIVFQMAFPSLLSPTSFWDWALALAFQVGLEIGGAWTLLRFIVLHHWFSSRALWSSNFPQILIILHNFKISFRFLTEIEFNLFWLCLSVKSKPKRERRAYIALYHHLDTPEGESNIDYTSWSTTLVHGLLIHTLERKRYSQDVYSGYKRGK